eukprot:284818844_5
MTMTEKGINRTRTSTRGHRGGRTMRGWRCVSCGSGSSRSDCSSLGNSLSSIITFIPSHSCSIHKMQEFMSDHEGERKGKRGKRDRQTLDGDGTICLLEHSFVLKVQSISHLLCLSTLPQSHNITQHHTRPTSHHITRITRGGRSGTDQGQKMRRMREEETWCGRVSGATCGAALPWHMQMLPLHSHRSDHISSLVCPPCPSTTTPPRSPPCPLCSTKNTTQHQTIHQVVVRSVRGQREGRRRGKRGGNGPAPFLDGGSDHAFDLFDITDIT